MENNNNSADQGHSTVATSTPTANDNQTQQEATKKNKPSVILLAIIAIITTVAAIIFAYLYLTSTQTPNNSSDTGNTESTGEEIAITNTYILRDLDEKMSILHYANYPQQLDGSIFISDAVNHEIPLYENGNLSDVAKLMHLIASIPESSYHRLSAAEKESVLNERESVLNEREFEYEGQAEYYLEKGIDADIVSAGYKDLYGADLAHGQFNDPSIARYCPHYIYNEEYNFYYDISACGGQWPAARQYYKYNYTMDGNHAYVYVAAGMVDATSDNAIYCDVGSPVDFKDNLEPCGTAPTDYFYSKTPFIDLSNYQDFAQYRFVFTKADDGTYYFSEVEKI